jgi:site-specific recombinase XerD
MPNKITNAVERWATSLKVGRSERTVKSYVDGANVFAKWLEHEGTSIDQVKRYHLDDYGAHLHEIGRTSGVISLRLLQARLFLKFCYDRELIDSDPTIGFKVPTVKPVDIEIPTPEEWKAILDTTKGRGFAQKRDRAVLMLLGVVGLRRHEVVMLRVSDVDLERRTVRIVNSKGGKTRVAALMSADEALDTYLAVRDNHPKAGQSDALFLAVRGGNFNDVTVHYIVKRRCVQAGIPDDKYHVHSFRHLSAANVKGKVSDVYLLNQFGWDSITMLRRYGKIRESEDAVSALNERFS